jgi:glycosyltransferase involved in cell wall biosynthesis
MPRLLSIGHSYVVALNRRLPHEVARAGAGKWEVVAVAPEFMRGDLRPIALESFAGEACGLQALPTHLSGLPHVMFYGRKLKALLAQSWDVIHCWEEPYVVAGAQIARWAGRAHVVPYSFQNIAKRYPPPFNWVEGYTLQRCSGWLAAGQTVRQTLAARPGYAGKPHQVMPLGVDIDVFRPDPAARVHVRRQLGWSVEGDPVVGYLGRFIPEKGLRLVMQILAQIRSPWRALLVGGGPLEGDLNAWAARFPQRVRVVTGIPHDGVPAYLNAMDLLVAPSQTSARWREQLGRMLLEAFACAVPVLGSDSGEIPFVLGDAGRVLGEADVSGWSAALGELLESPARRAVLGQAGRARAAAEFAWPVLARRHLNFFDELLAHPCPN